MIINILTYTLINFLFFIVVTKISYFYNLLDNPIERSVHTKPTAYTGGISLSLAFILSVYLFDFTYKLNLILSLSFLIALVGFIDDKFHLNVGGKLSLQIFPIMYLIISGNLGLNYIGDYNFFKLQLGTFSIPFTLLSILFLVNSFNYFDGIDGTLATSTISVISILFFLIPEQNMRLFLIVIFIPLLIFLLFNFSVFNLPKLFLGDSGSLLLGFVISFTLIFVAKEKLVHPILLAFSISIFVYEFISINIIRLKNKRNLFLGNKDHLHHKLFEYNQSIFQTNLSIFILNIFLFIIGYIGYLLIGPLASIIIFIILFYIYFILRNKNLI